MRRDEHVDDRLSPRGQPTRSRHGLGRADRVSITRKHETSTGRARPLVCAHLKPRAQLSCIAALPCRPVSGGLGDVLVAVGGTCVRPAMPRGLGVWHACYATFFDNLGQVLGCIIGGRCYCGMPVGLRGREPDIGHQYVEILSIAMAKTVWRCRKKLTNGKSQTFIASDSIHSQVSPSNSLLTSDAYIETHSPHSYAP